MLSRSFSLIVRAALFEVRAEVVYLNSELLNIIFDVFRFFLLNRQDLSLDLTESVIRYFLHFSLDHFKFNKLVLVGVHGSDLMSSK
jgi:hypothetical protein